MAAAKKIQIIYDIDGKAIDVAIDKTLNLQQQAKALTAELRRTSDPEAFKLLSSRLGDVQDGLSKTSAKSKDLFTSLSLLPGPIGMFFGQLSASVDLLKTFSSFSLKDLKFQLGETANDIGDIGKNLLSTTEAQAANAAVTETQAEAVSALAVAEAEAAVSSEAHTVAVEAETVATEAAEVATIGLGTALKAIGIGFLIAGIATLVAYWDKISDALTGATDKTRAYDEAQKQVNKDVTDFNIKLFEVNGALEAARKGTMSKKDALKEYNDKLGKTVGYAGSLEQAEALMAANTGAVIESIKLRAQAQIFYGKSAEASAKLVSGEGLEPTFWDKAFNVIKNGGNVIGTFKDNIKDLSENYGKAAKQSSDFAAEGDKLTKQAIENDKKLKKGLAEAPKETQNKELQDKELLEKAKKLQEELTAVKIDGELKRQKQEIDNAAASEIREIKALNISKENESKRQQAINDVFAIANKKKDDLQKKADEENKKKEEERLKEAEDFNNKVEEIRIAAIKDETEKAIAERQQKLTKDLSDLEKDKEFLKKTETVKAEIRKNYAIAAANDIEKINSDTIQKQLAEKLGLHESELKLLTENSKAYFDKKRQIEDDAYALAKEKAKGNADELEKIEKDHSAAVVDITKQEVAAKEKLKQEHIDTLFNIASNLQKISSKEKGFAKAGVRMEEALTINKIWMSDTKAIKEAYAASPLTFGLPWSAVYAADLITGVIVAHQTANNAISQIDSAGGGNSEGGGGAAAPAGNSSASLGKNYGDGGMIQGPRHAQGGTLINAEGGEAVMTRGAVTMFAPLLSALNQAGGGTSFANSMVSSHDNPARTNPAAQQEPMIMKTYVVSSELTTAAERQAKLKDLSTL